MSAAARPDTPWFPDDRKFVSSEIYDAFFRVVERLERAILGETAALTAHRADALGDFTRQKRQGVLELNRIMQAMERTIPSQDIVTRLGTFRRVLQANDAILRVHLRAAQEVTELIVKVMREAESDGTYSRGFGRADYYA